MNTAAGIILEGLSNTRDLGGIITLDGRHIRNKLLIRSGALMGATPRDIRILVEEYHLKTVIDFRTDLEMRQCPDPHMPGVTFINNPILQDKLFGITHEEEYDDTGQKKNPLDMLLDYQHMIGHDTEGTIEKLYENFVSDEFSIGQYRKFFDFLLNQSEGAVLWHCTAGKDRVGTGTALLLSVLGVDREMIIEDYMRTNHYLKAENEALLRKAEASGLEQELIEKIVLLGGVKRRYIAAVFRKMERRYGTVNAYLEQAMDLNAEKTAQLRNMYLE